MSDISAAQVKELRERTGAGMMDCKKALVETGGDMEKAVELPRQKGLASAAKRAGRSANQGLIEAYIHFNNTVGVLVEVNCETDFVANTAAPRFVSREEVSQDEIDHESQIFAKQAQESGKPENVVDKIVEGKINSYFKEIVLLDQPFVKDDSKTVQQLLDETSARVGEKVAVKRFVRYKLGEDTE